MCNILVFSIFKLNTTLFAHLSQFIHFLVITEFKIPSDPEFLFVEKKY